MGRAWGRAWASNAPLSGVNWMLIFGHLSRNLLLLVSLNPRAGFIDSNTRRWAWPSSGIAQFGASFIHNHIAVNAQLLHSYCNWTCDSQRSTGSFTVFGNGFAPMVDTRGEGRDGVPLRR